MKYLFFRLGDVPATALTAAPIPAAVSPVVAAHVVAVAAPHVAGATTTAAPVVPTWLRVIK